MPPLTVPLAPLWLAPYETLMLYGDSGQLGWPAPRICSVILIA